MDQISEKYELSETSRDCLGIDNITSPSNSWWCHVTNYAFCSPYFLDWLFTDCFVKLGTYNLEMLDFADLNFEWKNWYCSQLRKTFSDKILVKFLLLLSQFCLDLIAPIEKMDCPCDPHLCSVGCMCSIWTHIYQNYF